MRIKYLKLKYSVVQKNFPLFEIVASILPSKIGPDGT